MFSAFITLLFISNQHILSNVCYCCFCASCLKLAPIKTGLKSSNLAISFKTRLAFIRKLKDRESDLLECFPFLKLLQIIAACPLWHIFYAFIRFVCIIQLKVPIAALCPFSGKYVVSTQPHFMEAETTPSNLEEKYKKFPENFNFSTENILYV